MDMPDIRPVGGTRIFNVERKKASGRTGFLQKNVGLYTKEGVEKEGNFEGFREEKRKGLIIKEKKSGWDLI